MPHTYATKCNTAVSVKGLGVISNFCGFVNITMNSLHQDQRRSRSGCSLLRMVCLLLNKCCFVVMMMSFFFSWSDLWCAGQMFTHPTQCAHVYSIKILIKWHCTWNMSWLWLPPLTNILVNICTIKFLSLYSSSQKSYPYWRAHSFDLCHSRFQRGPTLQQITGHE